MAFFDISRKLHAKIATWPGDAPYRLNQILSIEDGSSVNLTTIEMSAHTGTHVDAPRHFLVDGQPLDQIDLRPFWGLAQVVTVRHKADGALTVADFADCDLTLASRLLVHSDASHLDPQQFPKQFVYPAPELGEFLSAQGVILYGSDAPSMDHEESKSLLGHKGLHANGISILEGLDLSDVPDGIYDLSALPLPLVNGDGSPVRAVLRTIE